jgi:uncharacterized membrane protein HdeD (DUF308 family)
MRAIITCARSKFAGKEEETMSMSLEAAAQLYRDAARETLRKHSLWYLIEGVLLVVAGILAIVYPFLFSIAAVVMLGWLLIASGVLQAIGLIGARSAPHFWLQLVSIALGILVGALLLRDPAQGLVILTLLLIIFLMIEGISKLVFALTIRPTPGWGWVLGSGVLGVVLAAVLWASMPVTATWLIGLLLGIELISVGASIAMLAWQLRS